MRFGIFSDAHLGVSKFRKLTNLQNTYSLINYEAFKEALSIIKDKNVDGIIIPGDLFHSPNPSVQSIVVANELSKLHIPIYLLGGNHDYSQRDNIIGYHPFHLINGDNLECIVDDCKFYDFIDCDLTMIPYKSLNAETFKKIYKGKLINKSKKSILAIHGYVDLNSNNSQNNSEDSEYALPKEIAANYDLVISGHVHIPQLIKTESTTILTPGSLMPSNQSNSNTLKPSVYIYDSSNGDIDIINLKNSPKIHNIITNDINQELQKISESEFNNDLYFIKYNGRMKDIDEYYYMKASQNVLNLSIQTSEIIKEIEIEKVSDFWNFIKDSHPNYYDEFKELLKGE